MELILAILLGALVGLRNEIVFVKKGRGPLGGFRSYIFIAILGYLSGVMANVPQFSPLAWILGLAIVGIILIYYFYDLKKQEKLGLTMELSGLIVFTASFILATHLLEPKIIVAIVILVAFLLASQKGLRHFLFAFKEYEVTQIALFATLTFVILPFLPDSYFKLADLVHILPELNSVFTNAHGIWAKLLYINLINPFKLWMFVVLVSGIEVLGYLVGRFVGQTTSIILTSLVSGFISSTSSTIAFSKQSRESSNKLLFLAAILIANAISFVEVYLLVLPVSFKYFKLIFLANTTLLVGFGILGFLVLILNRFNKNLEIKSEHANKIFDIKFAIGFAILLTVVQIITKIAYVFLGNAGFLITSALAGFSGINAVLINTGMLFENGLIGAKVALLTFLIVNIVNLLAKALYILINKENKIAWWFFVSVVLVILATSYTIFII